MRDRRLRTPGWPHDPACPRRHRRARAVASLFRASRSPGVRVAERAPALLLASALVHHAFNELDESNANVKAAVASGGLSDSLVFRLRALAVTNHLRRFRYREALRAADEALAKPPASIDTSAIRDLANIRRLVNALADVPAQAVSRRDSTLVRLSGGHIDVTIADSARRYVFDTGANFSTLARSEATALGLTILDADIDVGSSTDIRNVADLAVADHLTIGGLAFRNVVFLVFDDRLLTFPGLRIRGIVGFPVIEAMGEIRLRASGELIVPTVIPARTTRNLAMDGHTPLTTVVLSGDTLLCRLDTGANRTDFYEPFYRAHKGWVDSVGRSDTHQSGGVGGIRSWPVYRLAQLALGVGDTTMVLSDAPVMVTSIARTPEDNYLACNVGHDIFDAFPEYIFNFRDMAFLLRGP